jgi:hypothetical protein
MSSGNKVLSRGENPLGMFVKDNVLRTHQPLNPQRCRRRMRTEQQGLPANGVAMSEPNSLLRPLTVPTKKCQTTTIIHRRVKRPYYGTIWKWKSPSKMLLEKPRPGKTVSSCGKGQRERNNQQCQHCCALEKLHLIN